MGAAEQFAALAGTGDAAARRLPRAHLLFSLDVPADLPGYQVAQ